MTAEEIRMALAAPFEPDEIKFKPQTVSNRDGKCTALAVPYVDVRVVMDRLDDVLGVGGWQTTYRDAPGGSVTCSLRARIDGEWTVHEDVGGQSEQPDEGDRLKSAYSDALKRAAIHLGVGRYLYSQKPQWVDYDQQRRRFVGTPKQPVHHRSTGRSEAGVGNSPARTSQPANQPATQSAPPPAPVQEKKPLPPVQSVGEWVDRFDMRLFNDGVIERPGELAGHLLDKFRGKYPGPISGWPMEAYEPVKAAAKEFVESRLSAATT